MSVLWNRELTREEAICIVVGNLGTAGTHALYHLGSQQLVLHRKVEADV